MNIEKEFLEWVSEVYGSKGLAENQLLQLKGAFVSGAFITIHEIEIISREENEDIEEARLFNLVKAVKQAMKQLVIDTRKMGKE